MSSYQKGTRGYEYSFKPTREYVDRISKLPKDLIIKIAFEMDLPEILSLCNSSSKLNNVICKNELFWMKLLKRNYNIDYDNQYRNSGITAKQKYTELENIFNKTSDLDKLLLDLVDYGDVRLVKMIIDKGADPNNVDALIKASKLKSSEIFDLLLPFTKDNIVDGDVRILEIFQNALKNNNWSIMKSLINERVMGPNNVITRVILEGNEGNINIVKHLINEGADVNIANGSPMIAASITGRLDILKLLIENGARVTDDAFLYAVQRNQLNVVRFFVENIPNLNINDGLLIASRAGHLNIVKYLVEHGADIQFNNVVALTEASYNNQLDVIDYLIKQGADPRVNNGEAFLAAINAGNIRASIKLRQHGF